MFTTEHTAFKDDAWILRLVKCTKKVLIEAKKPFVGICFGHQVIGRTLGAQIGQRWAGLRPVICYDSSPACVYMA
ncbi:hypothetical protein I5L01_15625, partial [Erythrobacter sp. YJ-T3-07]|nr:hypothetical protein [Erythrobacter sp. YJ-T3-07]